jgi:hypothetical protein
MVVRDTALKAGNSIPRLGRKPQQLRYSPTCLYKQD